MVTDPTPSPHPQSCLSPRQRQSAGRAWRGRSIWRQRGPRVAAGECRSAAGHSACGCGWVERREAQQLQEEGEGLLNITIVPLY